MSRALLLSFALLPGVALAQDGSTPPAEGLLPEPRVITKSIDFGLRTVGQGGDTEKSGFYPELSNMVTGAGWLSGGPGYRHWLLGDRLFVDGSAAVSWRLYKMAQARVELTDLAHSRLAVGSQVRWQDLTQVTYFGEGADSLEANRSEYRMHSTDAVGYSTLRPRPWLAIDGRIGWLQGPTLDAPAGTFRRGNPAAREVFPDDPVFAIAEQPHYGYGRASMAADTRDHRGHPTRGGLYRVALARYSDRGAGTFSFNRYEAEGAQFVPVADSRIVLAVRGWLAASAAADDGVVPFYLLPSLGGSNTLRSYADYRFHDRNMVVLNAETRVALFTHVDAAVFFDAGNVAPRLADLNLDRTSYGLGFRLHTERTTLARFDVAHGGEGWRFLLRMNDPLHVSRLSRRTAPVPFVP